ncbi:MAG TPA: ABC transporter permease [Polyangiaceae bacterium]|nr:ABC transporter permease [Polyangiaceae bacterium]
MWSYLLRTILQRGLTLIFISIVSFSLVHLAPGTPSEIDPMNPRMRAEDVVRLRKAFHLDEPLYRQYALWVSDLGRGELRSFRDGAPVMSRIGERFRNSLPLFAASTLLIWTLSFPLGIHAAVRRGSRFDRTTTVLAYALISTPSFFIAYLAVLIAVRVLGLPVLGMSTFGVNYGSATRALLDRIWHVALPAGLAALSGVAVLSRYVRSQMLEVLTQDYVRSARARGLPEDQVVYGHALRNALLPFITMFGLMLPGMLGGSVIIEQIFAWPGIGRLGYEAIVARDYPMILTLNFLVAALTLFGVLLSDISYALADPRIRLS